MSGLMMALSAKQIYSIHGFFREVKSTEIRSREHARKIGPFMDDDFNLLFWVRSSYNERTGERKRKPYFSHYSSVKKFNLKKTIELKKNIKDKKHSIIQDILYDLIKKRIEKKLPIFWNYKDINISDLTLKGNLIENAIEVRKEYRVEIKPLRTEYIFDIVILGPVIHNQPIILAAIEIENTHEMDIQKTLLCKSIGFPLMVVDITELNENEINEELCIDLIQKTTTNSKNKRRNNYIYLHNLLFPLYIHKSLKKGDNGHQYVVFFHDRQKLEKSHDLLSILKEKLNIKENDLLISRVRINKSCQNSLSMQRNDIGLINQEFNDYDTDHYLRICLSKPHKNEKLWYYHMVLTKLLTLHFDCLVGYKYERNGCKNDDHENRFWNIREWDKDNQIKSSRLCPKELSEPVFKIIRILEEKRL